MARYRCSHCAHEFDAAQPPRSCPSCFGKGKARYRTRLPMKRLTHKQKRELARMEPAAFIEAGRKAGWDDERIARAAALIGIKDGKASSV